MNTSYGPGLEALLSGAKPLPPGYEKTRQARMKAAPSEDAIRKKIVQWALWGVKNEARIAYSQGGTRLAGARLARAAAARDRLLGFATLVYNWSGAPNPNFAGAYDPAKECYTGSMLGHCQRLPPRP